jgi:cation transport ATPase
LDEAEILAVAGPLERKSEHPLAEAIVRYAEESGAANQAVKDFEAVP